MADRNDSNDASEKGKAEEDRWESDSETVERYDETVGAEGGGITNRPLDEEIENQASLPDRGESREGTHAGRGHQKQEDR
jgi:hypothetical protein